MGDPNLFYFGNALNPFECNPELERHDPVLGIRHPMRVVVGDKGIVLLVGIKTGVLPGAPLEQWSGNNGCTERHSSGGV
jgi:hypothetical protein